MKPVIVACYLMVCFVNTVLANDAAKAMAAYHSGDISTALAIWKQRAEQGDEKAQLYLGYLHRIGKGITSDQKKSLYWYKQSAENGNANAQYEVGFMYQLGKGVKQDDWEAERWYGLAVDQGYCPGELLEGGVITEID